MKRLLCLVIVCVMLLSISGCSQIRISSKEKATISGYKGDADVVVCELTSEQTKKVRSILMDADYNPGIGGCYYDEAVSIIFGDQVFSMSGCCDTIWAVNTGKYYEISEDDFKYIMSLYVECGLRHIK